MNEGYSFVTLVGLFSDWWNKEYTMSSVDEKPLPPGSMGLPIVGETLQFLWKGTEYYSEKFKEYGNVFKCNVLGSPTVRVSGAENIRTLIDREPRQLTMKWPKVVNVLMGRKSLPTVVGPKHAPLKTDLMKAFTPTRLADYLSTVQEHIHENIQLWTQGEQKNEILGYPACETLVGDIMLELVLGCRKEDDTGGKMRQAFKDVSHNLFSIPVRFPFGGFNKACHAREVILDFVKSRMAGEGSEKNYVSMMDVLLSLHGQEEGGVVDEEKIKDNALGLMLASSASLAGAITILVYLLGTYPEVLEKVREELRDFGLFGKDATAELNYDLLQKLEYVHCVMKESLRILPPVGGCFRKSENQMEVGNYDLPADWTVIYSIRDTHTITAKLLPEGDAFQPSRWLKQEQPSQGGNDEAIKVSSGEMGDISKMADSSSCHYIPFGFGPRMCVGRHLAKMIMCTFIVELARTVRWDIINPSSPMVHLPVTKPKDDMPVIFEKL